MLRQLCILRVPERQARGAKSEVVPNKRNKIGSGGLTPCLLGGPKKAKCALQNQKWSPKKGEQNQKWLPQPFLLGGPKEGGNATSPLHSRSSQTPNAQCKIRSGPQQRGTKSQVLPHAYLLGGPKEGGSATSPLHSQGSPMSSTGSTIISGPQQRGKKSEVLASPLASRGPKRGRK